MIKRNVGNTERAIRFFLAVFLLAWVFTSSDPGLTQGLGLIAASALLWNSIFGRCYLWKWLGLSTCKDGSVCTSQGGGRGDSPRV